jgi:hypothetical protein
MDWPAVAATGLGSAWLSGINLYATVLTLGLLQRFGLARLPGDLAFLSEGWVIGLAAVLYLIEFVADKVPAVDTVWDAVPRRSRREGRDPRRSQYHGAGRRRRGQRRRGRGDLRLDRADGVLPVRVSRPARGGGGADRLDDAEDRARSERDAAGAPGAAVTYLSWGWSASRRSSANRLKPSKITGIAGPLAA